MIDSLNLDGLSTEAASQHQDLEHKTISEILLGINQEDKTVAQVVEKAIPQIESFVLALIERIKAGGRLFYIGAGTSGRLGILDASECPPTFGVSPNLVIGIIAGGEKAITNAVENAEDDFNQAWEDLKQHAIGQLDTVVGISASGRTPYVLGGLKRANAHGILTGCLVCNGFSAMAVEATFPIEVVVGSEFLTGSTRMKSGTAQKMVLNMISTSLMISLGKVKGNSMVDMQLSNEKLVERGTRMLMAALGITHQEARLCLRNAGNVRTAIENFESSRRVL
jgi:N-acetylmuramic acid 6-phosphate etherase